MWLMMVEAVVAELPGHVVFVNVVDDGIQLGHALFGFGELRGFGSQGLLVGLVFFGADRFGELYPVAPGELGHPLQLLQNKRLQQLAVDRMPCACMPRSGAN